MVAQISSFEKPSTRWQALNISSCSVSIMETAKTIWKIMNIQTYKQIVHMKHIWQRIIFNSFNIKTCILSYMMRCQGKHMFSSEVCLRLDKISGCCRRQYISGRGHTLLENNALQQWQWKGNKVLTVDKFSKSRRLDFQRQLVWCKWYCLVPLWRAMYTTVQKAFLCAMCAVNTVLFTAMQILLHYCCSLFPVELLLFTIVEVRCQHTQFQAQFVPN